jgi:TRAP-type C4-dicarboxylate transport system permease small subunit
MDLVDDIDSVGRVYRLAERTVINLAVVALFITMALVTVSSVSRYLFNTPVQETRPFAVLYLLIAIVFLALPRLQRDENNIKVFFLYDRVSERKQVLFDLIGRVLGLVFVPVLWYLSLTETYDAYQTNWHTTGAVEVPMYLSFGIMALGLTFFLIILAIQFIQDIKNMVSLQ